MRTGKSSSTVSLTSSILFLTALGLTYAAAGTVNLADLSVRVDALPAGTREGLNDWKRTGYGGPCPPVGRHRYFFKLYALDTLLHDLRSPKKADLEKAMQGHVIAQAELIGTYQKGAAAR